MQRILRSKPKEMWENVDKRRCWQRRRRGRRFCFVKEAWRQKITQNWLLCEKERNMPFLLKCNNSWVVASHTLPFLKTTEKSFINVIFLWKKAFEHSNENCVKCFKNINTYNGILKYIIFVFKSWKDRMKKDCEWVTGLS